MGNKFSCCVSHAPSQEKLSDRKDQMILKLLAEVNTLSSDESQLRWQPYFHSLVPLFLHCEEEGEVYVYRVSATGVDGTSFSAKIRVPGTNIRKTSDCFVQWRDTDDGGAWGLNFMSESDAVNFLEGCSPPTLTPEAERLRHAFSTLSLSLPIPTPPTAHHDNALEFSSKSDHSQPKHAGLDAIILQTSSAELEPDHSRELKHRTLDTATPEPVAPGSLTPSPSGISTVSDLPTPDISYASLLALDQLPPGSENPDLERYPPPPEFHDQEFKQASGAEKQKEDSAEVTKDEEQNPPSSNSQDAMSTDAQQQQQQQQPSTTLELEHEYLEGDRDQEEGCEEDLPELFHPSSPIEFNKEFILPDIMEENEDMLESEVESTVTGESIGKEKMNTDALEFNPIEEAGLKDIECAETSFSEGGPLAMALRDTATDLERLQEQGSPQSTQSPPETPILPLSPPPGPLLSPRYSLLFSKESPSPSPDLSHSNSLISGCQYDSKDSSSRISVRLSTISLADDTPPPLPSSLPPGKLISPRHSMILSQGPLSFNDIETFIRSSDSGYLDLHQLAAQLAQVPEHGERLEQLHEEEEEKGPKHKQRMNTDLSESPMAEIECVTQQPLGDGELSRSQIEVEGEQQISERRDSLLPPYIECSDEEYSQCEAVLPQKGSKLKLTPSFLQSLEPPKEFSDSGFLDTDGENAPTAPEDQRMGRRTSSLSVTSGSKDYHRPRANSDHLIIASSGGSTEMSSQQFQLRKDGSTTSYSDERLTEYSGSVGMKTHASSDSPPPSLTTGSHDSLDENKSTSSMSTNTEDMENKGRPTNTLLAYSANIRKTGWLDLKTVLVRKNRKVAMKSKRRWKKYWATLKGSSLLLYQCDDITNLSEDAHVDLRLDVELSLVQAVHDHVKRDNVFCLSTSSGNTYYMQTSSQSEVEDWTTAIHCAAAISLTKQLNKEEAVKILKTKTKDLNKLIEKENQLKKLTGLNLTAVPDDATRSMATKQLVTCAENIEKYSVELYRFRCYVASLQGTELPNPQSVLSSVSKPTKLALGQVGIFSVASLHAIVSARHGGGPSVSTGSSSLRLGRVKGSPVPSPVSAKGKTAKTKISSSFARTSEKTKRSLEISGPYPISLLPSSSPIPPLATTQLNYDEPEETTDADESFCIEVPVNTPVWPAAFVPMAQVHMPNNQNVQIALRNDMTVRDVLTTSCEKCQLNPSDHFLRLKLEREDGEFECDLPFEDEFFLDLYYTHIEVCQKFIHTVFLCKTKEEGEEEDEDKGFGLSLVPEWDSSGTGIRLITVGGVDEGGVAEAQGVNEGDEVVLVNDVGVVELGWKKVASAMEAPSVQLTLRTCHIEMSVSNAANNHIMQSLICPAPPSHPEISKDTLDKLIVPMPSLEDLTRLSSQERFNTFPELSRDQIDTLLKDSHELSKLLQTWEIQQSLQEATPWTSDDRLRKSASDLVETEREYIRLLDLLVERYLEPLKLESFISQEEVEVLSENVPEIVEFQKKFLKTLEDALALETDSSHVPDGESALKHVVFAIAGTFLYHVDHFRRYSTFCASLHKLKDILARQDNTQLHNYLEARNPKKDSTLNLNALLAKPIVRVARYPLFLNAMLEHTPSDSDERMHIQDAVDGMVRVADYINEMQRISETYSSLFDDMIKNSGLAEIGVSVSISQLWYHGEVMWLNPAEEQLAKGWKKGQGPSTLCFVFTSAIVLLCLDKKYKRRGGKPPREAVVTEEDVTFKSLLPCVQCAIHELPDSDGVTNMWQLHYRTKPSSTPTIYLFRSQSIEQKSTMVHLVRQSIQEQRRLYSTPSGRTTPTGWSSPSLTNLHSHLSPSPTVTHHLVHRVTSPTHSHLSLTTGYCTPSDTEHD